MMMSKRFLFAVFAALLVIGASAPYAGAEDQDAAAGAKILRPGALWKRAKDGDAEALKQLEVLAKHGDADAQFFMGVLYVSRGGNADIAKAIPWYLKAAEQGHGEAQYHLAVLYAGGKGVKKDYREALKWCRRSAEKGNFRAIGFLGSFYRHGLGGAPKDKDEAVRLYRIAAAQGDEEAQKALRELTGEAPAGAEQGDAAPVVDEETLRRREEAKKAELKTKFERFRRLVKLSARDISKLSELSLLADELYAEYPTLPHRKIKLYVQMLRFQSGDKEAVGAARRDRYFFDGICCGDLCHNCQGTGKCKACLGTGECGRCGGSGKITGANGRSVDCRTKCTFCDGRSGCARCRGVGAWCNKNKVRRLVGRLRRELEAVEMTEAGLYDAFGTLYRDGRGGFSKDEKRSAAYFAKAGKAGIIAQETRRAKNAVSYPELVAILTGVTERYDKHADVAPAKRMLAYYRDRMDSRVKKSIALAKDSPDAIIILQRTIALYPESRYIGEAKSLVETKTSELRAELQRIKDTELGEPDWLRNGGGGGGGGSHLPRSLVARMVMRMSYGSYNIGGGYSYSFGGGGGGSRICQSCGGSGVNSYRVFRTNSMGIAGPSQSVANTCGRCGGTGRVN